MLYINGAISMQVKRDTKRKKDNEGMSNNAIHR